MMARVTRLTPLRPIQEIVDAVLAETRDPDVWHWTDPLMPPLAGRSTPHAVALFYEEWLVYHANLYPFERPLS